MIYFINGGMPVQKSGIEHAQLKRIHLFESKGIQSTLLTRDWDVNLHQTISEIGITADHFLNMFDYFQQAEHLPSREVFLSDIDFGLKNLRFIDEQTDSRYIVQRMDQRIVAYVNYDHKTKHVVSVEHFDGQSNSYRVDFYDVRGFKSLSQWYTNKNDLGTQVWYSPLRQPVIYAFNQGLGDMSENIGWLIYDHDGTIHQFDCLDEVFEFFLNAINNQNPDKNTFILDRALIADTALTKLNKPAYTAVYLHNVHIVNPFNPADAILNHYYQYTLMNWQKIDIQNRFPEITNLIQIPVGVVSERELMQEQIKMSAREFGKIIVVSRIAYEKI